MATAHVIPFRPRRPSTARCLAFASYRKDHAASGEPVSPFRHLMGARELSPREIVHRRRMLRQLARSADGISPPGPR